MLLFRNILRTYLMNDPQRIEKHFQQNYNNSDGSNVKKWSTEFIKVKLQAQAKNRKKIRAVCLPTNCGFYIKSVATYYKCNIRIVSTLLISIFTPFHTTSLSLYPMWGFLFYGVKKETSAMKWFNDKRHQRKLNLRSDYQPH